MYEKRLKIAIITPGKLPLPSVKGGAVETLINYILDVNEKEKKLEIEVYSVNDNEAKKIGKKYKFSKFIYICFKSDNKHLIFIKRILHKFFNVDIRLSKKYIKDINNKITNKKYDYIIIENNFEIFKYINYPLSKKIIHIHNSHLSNLDDKDYELLKKSAGIIAVSEFIKNEIQGKHIDMSIYKLINCCEISKYGKNLYKDFRYDFRSKNKINDNTPVCIFAGRLDKTKGILELIRAFQNVNNDVVLLVVGSSWFSTNKSTEFTRLLEHQCNYVTNKIIFTGYIPFNEMPKYYACADIACLPSIWEEPCGNTIIESICSELPIISTVSGGIPELINSENAVLISRDDMLVNNLTKSINDLSNDITKRNKLSLEMGKIKGNYDVNNYYFNFLNILNKISERSYDNERT